MESLYNNITKTKKNSMEIKIENYLTDSEIKEIISDELRLQIQGHFGNEENAKRLLSNLAYQIVMEEVDKVVPNYHQELVRKTVELLEKDDLKFHVFNYDIWNGAPKSFAAKTIEKTVKENELLIKDKVIEAIQNKDYSEEALIQLENLSNDFTSNIYNFVELMRDKNGKQNI